MTLKDFVKEFIRPNTLIRLVFPYKGGHMIVAETWDKVTHEWELLKEEGIYKDYVDYKVLGVTDIIVEGRHAEAINIVIEE